MDFMSVFNISASGMDYQMLRVETIANNMANVGVTKTADGNLYQPLRAVAHSGRADFNRLLDMPDTQALQGVERVELQAQQQASKQIYDPSHPDANADGFIEIPNINPVTEMTTLTEATRAYEANIRVMNAAKTLAQQAMEIGR